MKVPHGKRRITSLPGMLSVLSWQPGRLAGFHCNVFQCPKFFLGGYFGTGGERMQQFSTECFAAVDLGLAEAVIAKPLPLLLVADQVFLA